MGKYNIDLQARVARARELFTSGYNCSQSVFLAYSDLFEVEPRMAATISAPLGGGMGRLREVCGAVSGMTMVAGFLYPNYNPTDSQSKKDNYAAVQELAEKFRTENGSIVCRELLGLTQKKDEPTPSPRTEEYYHRRPCAEYVAIAARIVGEKINSME
jgi:C_GCAxxG_C_C family probable redox protein